MKFYCGIGSRKTPKAVLSDMTSLAGLLAENDYCLRSGHAEGADMAFEKGCDLYQGVKEIFLPWPYFNNASGQDPGIKSVRPSIRARKRAAEVIPHWYNCSDAAQQLHGRNVHQVLGLTFTEPVEFVICLTKGGVEIGGTRTAMMIAHKHNIPVINMYFDDWITKLEKLVDFK